MVSRSVTILLQRFSFTKPGPTWSNSGNEDQLTKTESSLAAASAAVVTISRHLSELLTDLHKSKLGSILTYQYSHSDQTVLSLQSSCLSLHGSILALAVVCLPIDPPVLVEHLDLGTAMAKMQLSFNSQ